MAKPLIGYIKATYRGKNVEEAVAFATKKHKERLEFTSSLSTIQKKKSDLNAVIAQGYSYYSYLRGLQARFRIAKSKAGWGVTLNPFASKVVRLQFTWTDSFNAALTFTSYDIEHEKASILYTLASVQSYIGLRIRRENAEEIKQALHAFQGAAGMLDFMETTQIPRITTPKSGDMHPKLLQLVKTTMIAQAQECVFEACLPNSKLSKAVLASVAMGAADRFKHAYDLACGFHANQWLAKCRYPWKLHLQHKMLCWQSAAYYHLSRDTMEREEWGEEIAILNKALAIIKRARALEKPMRGGGWGQAKKYVALDSNEETARNLEASVVKRLKKANEENEIMYHATVPKESTIKVSNPNPKP
uniref:BRO1 domain-containing protein n=1 Tax=Lotharella globosa TaxID=91324 RepID=A0A7S3Z2B7_9EUKA